MNRIEVRELAKRMVVWPAYGQYQYKRSVSTPQETIVLASWGRYPIGQNELTVPQWETLFRQHGLDFEAELRVMVQDTFGNLFGVSKEGSVDVHDVQYILTLPAAKRAAA